MIKSMTGHSHIEGSLETMPFSMELKSVNNRFFDLYLRLPPFLCALEAEFKCFLRARIARGSVSFFLNCQETSNSGEVFFDKELFQKYYTSINSGLSDLQLENMNNVEFYLNLPNVTVFRRSTVSPQNLFPMFQPFLEQLCDLFNKSRETEGDMLATDITGRIEVITAKTKIIDSLAENSKQARIEKITERIKSLKSEIDIDDSRILQEIVIYSDKSDITEESVRFLGHTNELSKTIALGGEAGKKAGFILQEMHREINTMGTKTDIYDISKLVIEIKQEIEKIREQIQNIE